MNKIQIIKTTLHIVADIGGGCIVTGIVGANVSRNNIITKVCVPVAAFALGSAVGTVASTEIDNTVDRVVKIFKEKKTKDTATTE